MMTLEMVFYIAQITIQFRMLKSDEIHVFLEII